VDRVGGLVHLARAFDDLAVRVHEQQVLHADAPEVAAEGVHPEVVGALRVAGGDVAGHALVEAEAGEDPERRREPLLAVAALVVHRGAPGEREHRRGLDRGHHALPPRAGQLGPRRVGGWAERMFSVARRWRPGQDVGAG